MRRVSWAVSEATRLAIVDEYVRGDSVAEIARRHGVSETYVWQVRTAAGLPSRRPRRTVSRAVKEAALAAYLAGVKVDAIEAEFSVSRNTIYKLTGHRRRVSPMRGRRMERSSPPDSGT